MLRMDIEKLERILSKAKRMGYTNIYEDSMRKVYKEYGDTVYYDGNEWKVSEWGKDYD